MTVDPFRNDTSLRPYPCTAGTYCLTGVGFNEVVVGDFTYAQFCTEGFYCEAGSNSPRGNGLCPRGFICPLGTATPQPAPIGSYAELLGTIRSANCLPGFYAPTIETISCYPCPPGTACESEGTSIASLCPPGSYRSTLEEDGIPCVTCPQGFWSKNYGLRERGECVKCPPGSFCPVDGMTLPCAHDDLPSPFEPIVNSNGIPTAEYTFPNFVTKIYYNFLACLKLNDGYTEGIMDPFKQVYFFGELIPPYIDVLGRGPNFRATGTASLKFQLEAKCYRNTQRFGSPLYQRIADYHGPQYDIQFGVNHQGYGKVFDNGTAFYDGFFGAGSLYIDLPRARKFEPSYNCTKGFRLMNETRTLFDANGVTTIVYTDPRFDPAGVSREVLRGEDQLYPGTCEADLICYTSVALGTAAEGQACLEGYVCDEATSSSESLNNLCRAGYACDFGTTPDNNILALQSQFRTICPPGFVCIDGTSFANAYRTLCPTNYYCPSGTGDPLIGAFANDAINRELDPITSNPFLSLKHVTYLVNDDVRVVSEHDKRCLAGIDQDLKLRYERVWLGEGEDLNNIYLEYLRNYTGRFPPYTNDPALTNIDDGRYYRPVEINSALQNDLECARDHKWRIVSDVIERKDCDCTNFFGVVIAVYRLWKCYSTGILDNLGLGSVLPPYRGGRDYWFKRIPRTSVQCIFPDSQFVNLTHGAIFANPIKPSIGNLNSYGVLDVTDGVHLQTTWTTSKIFTDYDLLKAEITVEYNQEYVDLASQNPTRDALDPYVFDLYKAISLIEEYGEQLEQYVWLVDSTNTRGEPIKAPGRLDMCECEKMNKCPNGTYSVTGAVSLSECASDGLEVLRRISVIPPWYNETFPSNLIGHLANVSDFTELAGADASLENGFETYTIGTIVIEANDVLIVTMDFTNLDFNLTYGKDFQVSVYVDCKPCPARYLCDYSESPPTCNTYPTIDQQQEFFQQCLDKYNFTSCLLPSGMPEDCSNSSIKVDSTFQEPDLFKCQQIPFFCDDQLLPKFTWDIVMENGLAAPKEDQEESSYIIDPIWQAEVDSIQNPTEEDLYFQKIPGCCRCERKLLPYYFKDNTADLGFPDNKHTFVQLSMIAVEHSEITVVIELLNGQFYENFDDVIPGSSDIYVYRPSRANYTPTKPTRASFLTIIESSFYAEGLAMPLNMPMSLKRNEGILFSQIGGTGLTSFEFELKLLIGRISDLYQSDRTYEERYLRRLRDVYVELVLDGKNTTSFGEFANVPDTKAISDTLYQIADPVSDVTFQQIWWSNSDPSEEGYLALPYLPYFSNCKGSDSYVHFMKLIETDPFCELVDYDDTIAVNSYPWTNTINPNADQCSFTTPDELLTASFNDEIVDWLGPENGALYECIFEENIEIIQTNTRWYEAEAQTTLFYFTVDPIPPSGYEPVFSVGKDLTKEYEQYWGRGDQVDAIRESFLALPVAVSSSSFGQIGVVPRQVILTISYYQVTQGLKRLVLASVAFPNDFQCVAITSGGAIAQALQASSIPQCVQDINGATRDTDYLLQVVFLPLPWFDLLNNFQFTEGIYLLFFVVTGILAIGISAFIWGINRLLTKLRHPPPFHGLTLLYIIAQPALFGCALGAGPTMIAIIFLWSFFQSAEDGGTNCSADPIEAPSASCFQDIYDWTEEADPEILRAGRQQLAIIGVGFYCTYVFANLVMPNYTDDDRKTDVQRALIKANRDLKSKSPAPVINVDVDEDELPPDESFKPHIWRRMNFVLLTLFIHFCLMVQMEFSFSDVFEDLVYQFILIFKIFYFVLELVLMRYICPDAIQNAPMVAAISIISGISTMGASTFTEFVLSYFADVLLSVIERLYVAPFISDMINLWPRWRMMLRRRFRGNKRLTRDEKAKEELEWRRVNELIELAAEGVEPLLDSLTSYFIDTTGIILSPLAFAVLDLFFNENQIAPGYGILTNQFIYYISFAIVIVPFTLVADVFGQNCQELIHGWKIFDYLSYQRYRFSVREYRWMLRNPVVDESISEEYQSVDLLCFSSQHFFLLALLCFGMVNITLSISGILRLEYNPFGDPCALLMFLLIFLMGEFMQRICWRMADIKIRRFNWRGLWATKQIEGTIDDDIAAKLAIGEGRQADLEQERLELQAMNSERFRHRFLERNRPWILQHLVELLTPRTLDQPGPDGRPAIEYVRDVYAELMAMGEGYRKPGDREDISSDEEDELENARRNWPRDPLTGASLAIARMWLAKARKRRAFSKLIRGIIDQNKKTACEICGRTPEKNNVKLTAHLATDGQPDISSIDRLIGGFEQQYGPDELEPQLWKAYFRAHAQYCTRCNICEDSMEQERLVQASRAPGPSRQTRPQDISSDEDDDDADFEPVVVTRTSPEGRMMSKWLVAARKKLGGPFPRPDARKQMERYAQKLRELKMKKARDRAAAPSDKLEDEGEKTQINNATKALALRWIRMARDALDSKFRMRSETFREDLDSLLKQMPEEEDWYYGAAMRLEGKDLLKRGSVLEDDRRTLEAEAAVKIHKIDQDLKDYLSEREKELDRERKLFNTKLAQQRDRINLDIDIRKAELDRLKEQRKKEFMAEERKAREELGAAPTEMMQDHRNQLLAIDDLSRTERENTLKYRDEEDQQARIMFDRAEMIKLAEMEKRKATASENTARIRQEVAVKVKIAEAEWQGKTSKWLAIARRKVQVKKKEDEDARAGKRKRKGGK